MISVSSSSDGGVGVADDADARVEAGFGAAQEGAAQGDAELAVVVGVGPADGAGVPAAVQAFEGRDQRARRRRGARRRRRGSGGAGRRARSRSSGWASWARIGVARCWMFATLIRVGLVGGGDPDGVGAQGAGDAADDDRLLLAVLVGAQELLAEVVVDGGVGGAAGGAGQGDGLGAVAVAADQQLGRGGDEGGVAAAGAEDVTGLEARAQDAEDGGGVVRRRRVDGDLAGEDDLLERAGADALDGAGDGGLVVLGRGDGVDRGSGRRAPGRAAAAASRRSAGGAGGEPRGELLGDVVRRGERGERRAGRRRRGGRARPPGRSGRRRRSRPSAARGRRPGRTRTRRRATRPAPGRAVGRVGDGARGELAPGARRRA